MENLDKEHKEARREMRRMLLSLDDEELTKQYYKTITLAEHEAVRRESEK